MEGRTVSHYRVLEKLGGGGMGVVYKARDTRLDRFVALKFLPPELTRDDDAKQRFMHEAKVASALDHPNICTIHDVDETPDGQMFLAMAYYAGETLKQRIARGPLPVAEAIDIASQVAQGLVQAHDAGIVHRDIKPANLIVSKDGVVKILAFGIAKLTGETALTRTGITLGTMAYMSPEQLAGADIDHRVDFWALGAVLYQMLIGQLPFRGEPEAAVLSAILNDPPKPVREIRPDVSDELEQVVSRALKKNRDDRYGSASELRSDLADRLTTLRAPAAASPLAAVSRALWTPKVTALAAMAVVLLVTAAVLTWNRGADARWAREEAIPEVLRLIGQDGHGAAYALAEEVERHVLDEPILAGFWPEISGTLSLATTPPGSSAT